jgi:hypothetical protein
MWLVIATRARFIYRSDKMRKGLNIVWRRSKEWGTKPLVRHCRSPEVPVDRLVAMLVLSARTLRKMYEGELTCRTFWSVDECLNDLCPNRTEWKRRHVS